MVLRVSTYLAAMFLAQTVLAEAQDWTGLSGQRFLLHEVIEEPQGNGLLMRTRFVLDGATTAFEPWMSAEPETDMAHLCDAFVQTIADKVTEAKLIIVSVAAEPTEFGVAAPGVPQIFEAYSVADTTCQWEPF